jgi:hypothetical protein
MSFPLSMRQEARRDDGRWLASNRTLLLAELLWVAHPTSRAAPQQIVKAHLRCTRDSETAAGFRMAGDEVGIFNERYIPTGAAALV